MQFTEHTDLGLRLLITLGADTSVRRSSSELAAMHNISHSHVQKVIQSLVNAGFVKTFRGRSGGVQLGRLPDDIAVGEVVRALEPHLDLVECFRPGKSNCRLVGGCALTHLLLRAKGAMLAELDRTTIGDIIRGSPAALELDAPRE